MKIQIRQYHFELSEPFFAGLQPLTYAEAQALNRTRARNIQDAMTRIVVKAEQQHGSPLPAAALADLTDQVCQYDQKYHFTDRAQASNIGVIELEAEELARELAAVRAKSAGRELSDDELADASKLLLLDPNVQAEARRRIAERRKISAETLEDLL